jgi:SAM-dependent methyltransferase
MSVIDRKKWDAKYAQAASAPRDSSAVLRSLASYLPPRGSALDVAGGAGRNAIWLAQRGLTVTIADVSSVGLQLAHDRAAEAGVKVETLAIDLEQDRLAAGPFDLIVSVCYLWRPLFAEFPRLLDSKGTLAVVQPTRRNLERNDKPPAAYLLDEGELRQLVSGLEIVHYEEGWLADGRHDAVVIARKPSWGRHSCLPE